jgi:16S rRNA G966 N2-methylase RsmD
MGEVIMSRNKRDTNILLRVNNSEKTIINTKSKLFNRKTSDYLRHAAFSYWENINDTKHFKSLLEMYQNGDQEIKEQVVEILFQYYRRNGFPHVSLTDEQKENRLNRIIKSKNILLEGDHLQINHQGIDLSNSYHHHMMDAYYSNGNLSPMETFKNDVKLKDCINRWLELGNVPNFAGMRRILKTRNGTRSVGNFKPAVAKFIYDNYCPIDGKVLDPCAGYSGRLAGCIASNRGLLYHGIDSNGKTAIGNMKMASFFSQQYDALNERIYKYDFRFDMGMAEKIMPNIKEEYDLIFTSPPYFNLEVYSSHNNQSHNNYQEWLKRFLFVIVDESKRILKPEGYLILNVKNIDRYKIADDLCEYCDRDWILEKTYHMRLSNNEFNRGGDIMHHTEPILVFSKK